jgi:hypothetical protein
MDRFRHSDLKTAISCSGNGVPVSLSGAHLVVYSFALAGGGVGGRRSRRHCTVRRRSSANRADDRSRRYWVTFEVIPEPQGSRRNDEATRIAHDHRGEYLWPDGPLARQKHSHPATSNN